MTGNPLLPLWHYQPGTVPRAFGEPTSYHKAYDWLSETCDLIEDWGCALAYGRTLLPEGRYRGIDGTPEAAPYADLIADLIDYTSDDADGIVIRHVLEHNPEWRVILGNAVRSFRKRLVLIIFTPFAETTYQRSMSHPGVPDLSFAKDDLLTFFDGLTVTEEHIVTDTQFGSEHIFFVERPQHATTTPGG